MTVRRTASGLSNQHLFLKVDAIVFIEGGQKSYSLKEAYKGKFNNNVIDIKYWNGLFSIYHNKYKLEFRAIGSKETLKGTSKNSLSPAQI